MARSIRDDMKRNIAQAVNHLANTVLDVNTVYLTFVDSDRLTKEAADTMTDVTDMPAPVYHTDEIEFLQNSMIYANTLRERLLAFAAKTWALDEESLGKYL